MKCTKLKTSTSNVIPPECQQEYVQQFTDRRNAVHKILFDLVRYDNDMKRISFELKNVQVEFKLIISRLEVGREELNKINVEKEAYCVQMEDEHAEEVRGCDEGMVVELKAADNEEGIKLLAEKVGCIESTNERFSKLINQLKSCREDTIKIARESAKQLIEEKYKFRLWHEGTIEDLKRSSVKSCDEKVRLQLAHAKANLEELFCKEVKYVKSCVEQLRGLFLLIDGDEESCVKSLKSSTSSASSLRDTSFDFDWIPRDTYPNQFEENVNFVKQTMKISLSKAYATMHMHQPEDPTAFIAGYLLHLQRMEEQIRERNKLFEN